METSDDMFKGHITRLSDPEKLSQIELESNTGSEISEIESMDPYHKNRTTNRKSVNRKTALLEQVLDKATIIETQ